MTRPIQVTLQLTLNVASDTSRDELKQECSHRLRYAFESSAPPRPQLSPITPLGPATAPQMLLSWFCPSVNIERFEVGIAALGDEINADCAPGFLDLIPPPSEPEFQPVFPELTAVNGLDLTALEFRRFLTPQPGGTFGAGDRFVVPVDIEIGRHYEQLGPLRAGCDISPLGTRPARTRPELDAHRKPCFLVHENQSDHARRQRNFKHIAGLVRHLFLANPAPDNSLALDLLFE